MPIALETFKAPYGDDDVTIVVGEWAQPRHELVRRYPSKFRADPPARVGNTPVRQSRTAPTPPHVRGRTGVAATLPKRYAVELTPSAWEELGIALGEWDGCEVGGGLFGRVSGDRIVVEGVGRQAWGSIAQPATPKSRYAATSSSHDRSD